MDSLSLTVSISMPKLEIMVVLVIGATLVAAVIWNNKRKAALNGARNTLQQPAFTNPAYDLGPEGGEGNAESTQYAEPDSYLGGQGQVVESQA